MSLKEFYVTNHVVTNYNKKGYYYENDTINTRYNS